MKYYFDPKIKYSTFKKVNDALLKIYLKKVGGDIVMESFDKVAWQLLHERKINIGVDTKNVDAVFLTLKDIPKNAKLIGDVKKPLKNKDKKVVKKR